MILSPIRVLAVSALPTFKTVIQKDSTLLEVFLQGDEHSHSFFTRDYVPVAIGDDGSYYYLMRENGVLRPSSLLAHEANERMLEEKKFVNAHAGHVIDMLSTNWMKKAEKANSHRRQRAAKVTRNYLGEPKTYTGSKKGLVILAEFANKKMSLSNANNYFNRMFNEVGFHENNAIGSVHDYFYDQSYGQFNLSFDVVGPVTLSNDYGYYGSNGTSLDGGDLRAGEMIVEACQLVDNLVNFADYDWDGDGETDQVFVIYAGYGEASGGAANTIWPHESLLEYHECGTLNVDGVTINTYACSCELTGGSGTTLNGIGTACHEFTHCLGLPDFYDTGYTGGFGMNSWDLMAAGSYCGPDGIGEVPTGYSAYERWFAGWLDIKELKEPCVINNMPCIGDEAVAYAVYNDNRRDEYFLLENRQNTGWYSFVGTYQDCHGLLVTHVDYSETAWKNNKVNSSSKHQRMTIIPADMSYGNIVSSDGRKYYIVDEAELQGDLFPGVSNITELTNTSHDVTGGRLYNLNTDGSYNMNKPLTEISESDGLISFYFMGGIYVPVPDVLDATEVADNSFVANWNSVEGVDSYTLELSAMKPQGNPIDNILISENLAKFKTGSDTEDGFEDLSDHLNNYMQHTGWSGQKVFTSQYGVKIGTTSNTGYLTTPILNVKSSNLTIKFTAKAVTSAGANIQFVLMNSTGSAIELQECKLYYQPNRYVVNFENFDKTSIMVKITSSERVYLSDIIIYDGFYGESDFTNSAGISRMTGVHSVTYDDILENKLYLNNLTEEMYRYRVRANIGNAHSGWSQYKEIDLKEGSGLHGLMRDENLFEYELYTLGGVKINKHPRPGVYIRRNKKGFVEKTIIK